MPIIKSRKYEICGYCGHPIFQDSEAGGRLFILSGRPICALCRIKRGKKWKQIDYEVRKNLAQDLINKEKAEQAAADRKVMDIAIKSQEDTGTAIVKK